MCAFSVCLYHILLMLSVSPRQHEMLSVHWMHTTHANMSHYIRSMLAKDILENGLLSHPLSVCALLFAPFSLLISCV